MANQFPAGLNAVAAQRAQGLGQGLGQGIGQGLGQGIGQGLNLAGAGVRGGAAAQQQAAAASLMLQRQQQQQQFGAAAAQQFGGLGNLAGMFAGMLLGHTGAYLLLQECFWGTQAHTSYVLRKVHAPSCLPAACTWLLLYLCQSPDQRNGAFSMHEVSQGTPLLPLGSIVAAAGHKTSDTLS